MWKNMKKKINKFLKSEVEGIGVVEIILILVVLIGLVIIFRNQITAIVNNLFTKINTAISTF